MKTTASQIRVVCARGMRLRAERRPHEQTADPRRRAGEEHTEHDGDTQYDTPAHAATCVTSSVPPSPALRIPKGLSSDKGSTPV
jgi:hypothetical protein